MSMQSSPALKAAKSKVFNMLALVAYKLLSSFSICKTMDFGDVLTHHVFDDSSKAGQQQKSPQLLLLVSRGPVRHEEVFSALVAHVLSSQLSSESAGSLLLALYHSARRYQSYLDPVLRRLPAPGAERKHHLATVDLATLGDSPLVIQSGEANGSLEKIKLIVSRFSLRKNTFWFRFQIDLIGKPVLKFP